MVAVFAEEVPGDSVSQVLVSDLGRMAEPHRQLVAAAVVNAPPPQLALVNQHGDANGVPAPYGPVRYT